MAVRDKDNDVEALDPVGVDEAVARETPSGAGPRCACQPATTLRAYDAQ